MNINGYKIASYEEREAARLEKQKISQTGGRNFDRENSGEASK